jgi:hypothetical protein
MKPTYTIPTDPITGEPSTRIIVKVDEDGREWFIPCDEDNRMYQEYLKHEAKTK